MQMEIKVVAANNQLTVTDETEYVNPTGTLRTTVKADSTVANATKSSRSDCRESGYWSRSNRYTYLRRFSPRKSI